MGSRCCSPAKLLDIVLTHHDGLISASMPITGSQNKSLRWGLIFTLALILSFSIFRHLTLSYPIPPIFRQSFTVPKGASASRVAQLLEDQGLVPQADIFVNAVRLKMGTRRIQPGRYLLINVRHAGDLARQILQPDWRPIIIYVPEGAGRESVARYFAAKTTVDADRFMALTSDKAFMEELGIGLAPHMEGYLHPETYFLRNGVKEPEIIREMVAMTLAALDDNILERGKALGLNSHEILTMASIVEGEALLDSERSIISAVYHNRLRRGMRLQADPTVQYAIPDGPRRLLFRDYKYPSEYNTYLRKGLPPGPVNNPGRASIWAAVNPEDVNYIYFVANGKGGHVFTYSLDEHNQAIRSVRGSNAGR